MPSEGFIQTKGIQWMLPQLAEVSRCPSLLSNLCIPVFFFRSATESEDHLISSYMIPPFPAVS